MHRSTRYLLETTNRGRRIIYYVRRSAKLGQLPMCHGSLCSQLLFFGLVYDSTAFGLGHLERSLFQPHSHPLWSWKSRLQFTQHFQYSLLPSRGLLFFTSDINIHLSQFPIVFTPIVIITGKCKLMITIMAWRKGKIFNQQRKIRLSSLDCSS